MQYCLLQRSTVLRRHIAVVQAIHRAHLMTGEGAVKRARRSTRSSQPEAAAAEQPQKKPRKKAAKQSDDDGDASEGQVVKPKKARSKPNTEPVTTGLWLMKNEPEELSMDILAEKPNQTWCWDGVRGYEARNHMRNMKVGDLLLFYYSSCKVPGIAGIAKVTRTTYPDPTAWDPQSKYYDPKSDPENPRWDMVDVQYVRKLERFITLTELKSHQEGLLQDLKLFTRLRLSVLPVSQEHWDAILQLEKQPPPQ